MQHHRSRTRHWSRRPIAFAPASLRPLGAAHRQRSGGHAPRVRPNAALTAFAAWFGTARRAAEPGCCTCHGGRQAFGLPSPAQVSAALGVYHHSVVCFVCKMPRTELPDVLTASTKADS